MANSRKEELSDFLEQLSLATKPGQIQIPGQGIRLFSPFNPKRLHKNSLPIRKLEIKRPKPKEEVKKTAPAP